MNVEIDMPEEVTRLSGVVFDVTQDGIVRIILPLIVGGQIEVKGDSFSSTFERALELRAKMDLNIGPPKRIIPFDKLYN